MRRGIRLAALGVVLAAAVAGMSGAQTAISADGVVESTSGGFKFPDGTFQLTAAVAGSAPVEDTGQQTCYDSTGATADEVPCAGTGQDGEKQAGVDWPAPRFTDNRDGTVTDNLTGLIWLKDADCFGVRNLTNALLDANGLMSGQCGLTDNSVAADWRLPNVKELSSLVDFGQYSPALPSGHPFSNVQSAIYWSSSSLVALPDVPWVVGLEGGSVVSLGPKTSTWYVWPVRGGQ